MEKTSRALLAIILITLFAMASFSHASVQYEIIPVSSSSGARYEFNTLFRKNAFISITLGFTSNSVAEVNYTTSVKALKLVSSSPNISVQGEGDSKYIFNILKTNETHSLVFKTTNCGDYSYVNTIELSTLNQEPLDVELTNEYDIADSTSCFFGPFDGIGLFEMFLIFLGVVVLLYGLVRFRKRVVKKTD